MLRLDRNPLGPRVFAFGRRIHEWHLGLAVLALAVGGHAAGFWPMSIVPLLAATAPAAKDKTDFLEKRDSHGSCHSDIRAADSRLHPDPSPSSRLRMTTE